MFRSFSDKKSPRKSFRLKPPFTRHAISILICAACMLCATLASFLYQHIVPDNHANVALFYILALVIIARWTVGYGYGIACTLFSVIAINYLFTYPYYKLNFTLTGYPITFLLMSGITLILCTMTSHMTIQSEMIAEREKRLAEAEMEKNACESSARHLPRSAHAAHRHHRQQLPVSGKSERSKLHRAAYDHDQYLRGFQLAVEYGGKSAVRHSYPGRQLKHQYHRGTGGGSGGRSFGKAEKALSRMPPSGSRSPRNF